MAEKRIVRAEGERKASSKGIKVEGNAKGLRIGAIALWVLGIVFEVLCIGFVFNKFQFMGQMAGIIVTLVLDMISVGGGSLLWKKANHIDPASNANKTKFWIQNNLGVLIACVAFLPVIVILLTNKNLDKQTKTIGTVVAVVCMAIAGLVGYDFNPVSKEEMQEELQKMDDPSIDYYWVKTGEKYHIYSDCHHITKGSTQEEIICGSVGQAEEAGKKEVCKTCWNKHMKEKKANGEAESKAAEIPEPTTPSEETDAENL